MMVAFTVAIAMVCGINVFNAQKSESLSEIVLANVEALAVGEGEGDEHWGCPTYGTCSGIYYVCQSDYDSWWDDAGRNCSALEVILIPISGC